MKVINKLQEMAKGDKDMELLYIEIVKGIVQDDILDNKAIMKYEKIADYLKRGIIFFDVEWEKLDTSRNGYMRQALCVKADRHADVIIDKMDSILFEELVIDFNTIKKIAVEEMEIA